MFIFTLKHPQPTQTDFYYQMVNYYLTSHFKQFGINLKFKFSLVCISNEKDFFFMHRLPIKGNCTQNTLNSIQNNKTFFSLFFCYVNFVIKQTPGYTYTVKRNFPNHMLANTCIKQLPICTRFLKNIDTRSKT